MSWSQVQVQFLIDLYKQYPCLYAVKHREYSNKHARNQALDNICQEMKKVRPGIGIQEIKNKFNNIRTNFMTHYRKYSSAFHSGMSEDERYKPNIWYFDAMMFIVEHTTPREAVDSISIAHTTTEHISDIVQEDSDTYEEQDSQSPIQKSPSSPSNFQSPSGSSQSQEHTDSVISTNETVSNSYEKTTDKVNIQSTPSTSNNGLNKNCGKSKGKKRKADDENDIIQAATSSLRGIHEALTTNYSQSSDANKNYTQSELFGKYVTQQLSCIEQFGEELLLDVQHEISDVLYKARKKCLQKNSIL